MKKNTSIKYMLSISMIMTFFATRCNWISPQNETVPFAAVTPGLVALTIQGATPSVTKALSPASTATAQEREDFLRSYLSNNLSCDLPCWWNVIPGETAWSDVEKLLNHMGANFSSIPGYGLNSTFHGIGGFDFIDITGRSIFNRIGFEEYDGVVDAILINSEGYNNPEEFQSLWKNYPPKEILKIYGVPDRIWINVAESYASYRGYFLWFFYDRLGFMIRYPGEIVDAPVLHVCLGMESIAAIDISLQSSNSPLYLERFDALLEDIRLETATGKLRVVHSIQDATGLDEKQFYDVFMREDPACFDTPQDIWTVK